METIFTSTVSTNTHLLLLNNILLQHYFIMPASQNAVRKTFPHVHAAGNRRKASFCWDHFQHPALPDGTIDSKSIICTECNVIMKYAGSTTNAVSHLKNKQNLHDPATHPPSKKPQHPAFSGFCSTSTPTPVLGTSVVISKIASFYDRAMKFGI